MTDEMVRSTCSWNQTSGHGANGDHRPRAAVPHHGKTGVMKRILPVLFLATAVLLTGCDVADDARPSGPPITTETPSRTGTELADRYRKAGGDADVYGIQHTKDHKGVLVLSVWTHKMNRSDFSAAPL
ncbi:hypothetical protein MOV08_42665 [Streptomyces yunnanensis]|uniref:Uncharacterized protein n=1 Tax=Streptomyces yunnanensis TaxID=156453 RepID=A0ABY8AJY7_9ACTN|nr:hypothetical protein [Streptomyces yunnanensis]WEB45340.1 hypothetical protein MOV08_42665 [Streptomyces yunnanensis]